MKWTWIIASVLLSAGCSQMTAYQAPNPCDPEGKWPDGTRYIRTPHMMALGEGHTVVCQ